METEMQTLVEIKKEIEADVTVGLVDEEYCVELINRGNLLQGYGLWLAKTEVHKDNQTGWEKFCDRVGVTKRSANYSIEFYTAKSGTIVPDLLPDKEFTFRALRGETVEDKVEQYHTVKMLTGKDAPTAEDITLAHKVKINLKASPEKQDEVITAVSKASSKVKAEFNKTLGVRGVIEAFKLIQDGGTDDAIIDILKGKAKEPKPEWKKDYEKDGVKYRKEIKALEDEISKLKAELNNFNYIKEFKWCISSIASIIRDAKTRKLLEGKIFRDMKPHIKQSLELLKLPTNREITEEELKKAYRDRAKVYHPDKPTGDVEIFKTIKESYDILKGALHGK